MECRGSNLDPYIISLPTELNSLNLILINDFVLYFLHVIFVIFFINLHMYFSRFKYKIYTKTRVNYLCFHMQIYQKCMEVIITNKSKKTTRERKREHKRICLSSSVQIDLVWKESISPFHYNDE